MKKTIALILMLTIVLACAFCGDISATTIDGRSVILHDDGTWEYRATKASTASIKGTPVGTWAFPEDLVDRVVDSMLSDMGYTAGSSMYNYMKAMYNQIFAETFSELSQLVMELRADGTVVISNAEESSEGTYTIDDDRILYLNEDFTTEPFGTFNEDYTKFYMMGFEVDVCMVKQN